VEKIYQPGEYCLQIIIYSGQVKNFLTIRTAHSLSALYLAEERTGARNVAASDFCMKLRRNLNRTVLEDIKQLEADRIVWLSFTGVKRGVYKMVLELFSTAANCFLLDEENKILAVMHPVAARGRNNLPGSPYTAPERGTIRDQESREVDFLEELMLKEGHQDYNSAVCSYYEKQVELRALQEEKQRLRQAITRERKRLNRILDTHKKTILQAEEAESYRECGEILAANFSSLRRGLESIRLPDLYGKNPLAMRLIRLDPSLSPSENVERYFKKYKKIKRGVQYARSHLVELKHRLNDLAQLEAELEGAATQAEIDELTRQAGLQRPSPESQARMLETEKRLPYRRFKAADGSLIMVGKGGKENEELTFRVARGRDLWLHVCGAPGAHVVLSCLREGVYSEDALLDAAHLAVFYSSRRGDSCVDVDYTVRKNLSKPKGLPPGKVVMSKRKTIHLRVDENRLARLLGRGSLKLNPHS